VLRVVFPVAETGFDPVRLSDVYSVTVTAHIFDAAYQFDHLARPVKLRPRVAATMPEHSVDFKVWTVRLRQGVVFADDPAFKGARRELTAQDFVYTLKRFADPVNTSPNWPSVAEWRVLGLAGLREKALADKVPFDYDREIEGVRAIDRYTVQYTLERPQPIRREPGHQRHLWRGGTQVVEFYGDKIMEHRWARARSGWRRGGARRASCSSATPTTARNSGTPIRRPATSKARPS
jgi:ABC-type oligopeptide transport system substrate-binding subunit